MAKGKATIWTQIIQLENKRKDAKGRIVKPMTPKERDLRKRAAKLSGKTARGRAISKGRKHSSAVKQSAKKSSTKNQRKKTMQKVYHR